MIKSILLSVDGSIYTESVLKTGVYLSQRLGAKLHALSVVDVRTFEWAMSIGADGFVPIIPSTVYLDESKRIQEEKANAVLKKAAEFLGSNKAQFDSEKAAGSPVEIICERARIVDLLIMGARGEFARWESKMIGATLEAVSRQVNKPILIVSKQFTPYKKILAPYDGSATANKALALAGYFGNKLNLPVEIITVSSKRGDAEAIIAEALTYLQSYDVACAGKHVSGTADSAICQYAHENHVDLIIMGAYGKSRIREAIIGSTTEAVMRRSQIPVLLMR